jgi:hypothetical protein
MTREDKLALADCASEMEAKRTALILKIDLDDALQFWRECEAKWAVTSSSQTLASKSAPPAKAVRFDPGE